VLADLRVLAGFEAPETRFAGAVADREVPEPAQVPTLELPLSQERLGRRPWTLWRGG
jgi:hypothetical protein